MYAVSRPIPSTLPSSVQRTCQRWTCVLAHTYHVLLEAIQGGALTTILFDVVMACPPEIKRSVQDTFLIDGERLVTSLTMTSIFELQPVVVGKAWNAPTADHLFVSPWRVSRDSTQYTTRNGPTCTPWPHSCSCHYSLV